ncbi:unnamed protein product [Lupinus luteus]|uniref:MBD domain-containing protein n=1 Tax=Lupinus luteus TaxID=3873 RepID=A0AAV1X8F2_LUPLU
MLKQNKCEQRRRGKRKNEIGSKRKTSLSEEAMRTVSKIKRRRSKAESEPECIMYDNNTPHYSWLLSGWVAEERRTSRRLYTYYYDPEGSLYYRKGEVKALYASAGIIVLED